MLEEDFKILFKKEIISAFFFLAYFFSGAAFSAVCTVSAIGVNFGIYDPLSAANVDVKGRITVDCDAKTDFTVKLSTGGSGSYTTREMLGSSPSKLNYNLFTNNQRTTVWGDGTSGTSIMSYTNKKKVFPWVYGRLYGGQNTVKVGVYSDLITVTVEY